MSSPGNSAATAAETPYPQGVRLELDADTFVVAGATVVGGSPARILKLSDAGARALATLRTEEVQGQAAAQLARKLTDAGIAHPVFNTPATIEATVLIPVKDRAGQLDRCLSALGSSHPVLVVDDASTDSAAIARVCGRHGVQLVARAVNGGPAAARNTAVAAAAGRPADAVLFLDSDCIPPADLIARLAAHFADPLVAAVAPRVEGGLDLGSRPARVAPGTRVGYVPTAALLVRRAALEQVGTFDETLRYGEDVDLVWRLVEAGWRVRYEPSVLVDHEEPRSRRALLRRRFAYGTSAGPLSVRHPGSVPPLVLHPWSALTAAGILTRRPLLAAAGLAGSTVQLHRTLSRNGVPADHVVRAAARSAALTWFGIGKWTTQFASPVLFAALALPGHRAGDRRAVAAALLLSGPLRDWRAGRPGRGPARFVCEWIGDAIAYGAGVITGCVRAGTSEPIRPALTGTLLRPAAARNTPAASTTTRSSAKDSHG